MLIPLSNLPSLEQISIERGFYTDQREEAAKEIGPKLILQKTLCLMITDFIYKARIYSFLSFLSNGKTFPKNWSSTCLALYVFLGWDCSGHTWRCSEVTFDGA